MKISLNWLQDYIEISESPKEIAQLLTQSGLEVGSIKAIDSNLGNLDGLLIGEIISCEPHPNADKLYITRVDVNQEAPLHIICGAPNVQAGQKVVVAPIGAKLHGRDGTVLKIKKAKIRGEISEGMLCAEDEIGVGDGHEGIIVLNTPLSAGTPASAYFSGASDTILDIELTPNRGDACSHLGVARELSALLDRPIQYPSVKAFPSPTQDLPIQVEILDHQACPRYAGITISNVKIQPSPSWLRDKLRSIGLNPVNNIVDVTNFVMHELGQPLHAFDYDQIVGKSVKVKQLQAGSVFVILDGMTRELEGTELMVCDQAGGISMAGILGGERTSIHTETQNIFLESAYFSPSVIRKTAKKHALQTDASFRYERGTDPNLPLYALQRACSLIQEIAQGEFSSEVIDLYPKKVGPTSVKVYYSHINRLLGQVIPPATIQQILNKLEIAVSHEEGDSFVAAVPPYRTDVKREVDIIEEIVRIYGYDRIETHGKLGSNYLARAHYRPQQLKHEISLLLAANGYYEICTNSLTKASYSDVADDLEEKQIVTIENPLSESLGVLRHTLLFSGLEAVAYNINRKQTGLRLFEFGKIYYKVGQQYVEKDRLGIWLTGSPGATNWMRKPQGVTFQDLHAMVHKILHSLGLTEVATEPFQSDLYEKGIQVLLNQTPLLTVGIVPPTLLKKMNINQPVFWADMDWDALVSNWTPLRQYQTISKFPPVKRDISLVLDKSVNFEAVRKVVAQQNNTLIQDMTVFDVYEGETLGPDKKAYALSFVLQGQDKTLDDKTIDQAMACLIGAFETQLGAMIRT